MLLSALSARSRAAIRPLAKQAALAAHLRPVSVLSVDHHVPLHGYNPASAENAAPGLPFDDPRLAYGGVPTSALARALACSTACTSTWLVTNAQGILDAASSAGIRPVADRIVRATFFRHFCGGESVTSLTPTVDFLAARGVGCVLDYAAESDAPLDAGHGEGLAVPGSAAAHAKADREHTYEEVMARSLESIMAASRGSGGGGARGAVAVKLTALTDPALLLELSKDLPSADVDSAAVGPIYLSSQGGINGVVERLAGRQAAGFESPAESLERRVATLAENAERMGVPLLIDAEQAKFQPAIDAIALRMQRRHNRGKAVVYNTHQAYLKGCAARLRDNLEAAEAEGWVVGAKLVRGAYMHQEKEEAEEQGRPSPIHDTAEATHASFDECADQLLDAAAHGRASATLATHNQASVARAADAVERLGLLQRGGGSNPGLFAGEVAFAQLLGMADHLTFTLARAGHQVYKYVPYGPVDSTIPYLLRRAQENSAVLGGGAAASERAMLRSELARRAGFEFGGAPPRAG